MELATPKQKRILIIFGLGIFFSGVLNLFYTFDWFGVNEIVYKHAGKESYVVGELLDSVGELTAWLIAIWCIKKATSKVPYGTHLISLYFDFKLIELFYVLFFNPFIYHANMVITSGIAVLFFLTKIWLSKYDWFRKLKVFKA